MQIVCIAYYLNGSGKFLAILMRKIGHFFSNKNQTSTRNDIQINSTRISLYGNNNKMFLWKNKTFAIGLYHGLLTLFSNAVKNNCVQAAKKCAHSIIPSYGKPFAKSTKQIFYYTFGFWLAFFCRKQINVK